MALTIEVGLADVFFGLCALLFIEMLALGREVDRKLHLPRAVKALVAGGCLAAGAWLWSPEYLGIGFGTIDAALRGEPMAWHGLLAKMLFTTITLSFGGSGGVVTPLFFVGCVAGSAFAQVFGLDPSAFAGIGMVGLLAGATNTPISATVMATEMFEAHIAPFAAGVCVISYLMTGHRSLFPSQVLASQKSTPLDAPIGHVLDHMHVEVRPQAHTFLSLAISTARLAKAVAARIWGSVGGRRT